MYNYDIIFITLKYCDFIVLSLISLVVFCCSLEYIFKALDFVEYLVVSFIYLVIWTPLIIVVTALIVVATPFIVVAFICAYLLISLEILYMTFIHYTCIIIYLLFQNSSIVQKNEYICNIYHNSNLLSGTLWDNLQLFFMFLRLYYYVFLLVLSIDISWLDTSGVDYILEAFIEKNFFLCMNPFGYDGYWGYNSGSFGPSGPSGGAPDPGPNNGSNSGAVFSNEESNDSNRRRYIPTAYRFVGAPATRSDWIPMNTSQSIPPAPSGGIMNTLQSTGAMNVWQGTSVSQSGVVLDAWKGTSVSNPNGDQTKAMYAKTPTYEWNGSFKWWVNGPMPLEVRDYLLANQDKWPDCKPIIDVMPINLSITGNPNLPFDHLPDNTVIRFDFNCRGYFLWSENDINGFTINSLKRGELSSCDVKFVRLSQVSNHGPKVYGLDISTVKNVQIWRDEHDFWVRMPNIFYATETIKTHQGETVFSNPLRAFVDIGASNINGFIDHVVKFHDSINTDT